MSGGSRIREIPDHLCREFEQECSVLNNALTRITTGGAYADLSRNEWLGGDQKANANEAPPERCATAMAHLRNALAAVRLADHEIAMFRAGVPPENS
jgi:hypothetical protein